MQNRIFVLTSTSASEQRGSWVDKCHIIFSNLFSGVAYNGICYHSIEIGSISKRSVFSICCFSQL